MDSPFPGMDPYLEKFWPDLHAYRKGRYHLTIHYDDQPDPPLAVADAKWAKGAVKAASKKKRS